ncbi:N-acetylmuramoyl-L-alanine amidase LytC precursor [Oxobacter pfennigii]|uniref:N-acetylmuramoyl-L-alanine amidase LytC n=1 Tax=Oxobacter pfennigii TaxID=36849 RepID=A0A0P8WA70_9CLOT|nr:cell wall-binding repeat-containing protein [Oxobacter pfennigii]KPU45506.1 N-acetylmuramoyl-L-alanine amidase LytC precursor [Oxobacter pfennigii]
MNFKKYVSIMCSALIMTLSFGSHAFAAPSNQRLSGSDRYGTSTAISREGWTENSDYAVIAYGEDFPDALSATPLAKMYNAPILLVSKDSLDSIYGVDDIKVSEELVRLNVKKVFIVGGTGVVSEKVENEIKALETTTGAEIEIERLAGLDRFETSLKVAEKVGMDNGIVITTGLDFPDALSIAPIASAKGMPILLVNNTEVNEDALNALTEKGYIGDMEDAPKAYIIGGTGVVGQNVEDMFLNKERLAGIDAYETNAAVLNAFEEDIDYSTAYIATRNTFPDALAGSALAALNMSPVIITGDTPSAVTAGIISSKFDSINNVRILGGEGAVTTETFNRLVTDVAEIKEILTAMENTMNAKSMENVSELSFNASTSGMPQEVQDQLAPILQMVNDAKLNMVAKSSVNEDNTIAKTSLEMVLDSQELMELGFWMDMDLTGETSKQQAIVKLSELLNMDLPAELMDKEYMVIDSEDMEDGAAEAVLVDYAQMAALNQQFINEMAKAIEEYMQTPGTEDFVAYKGEKTVMTPAGQVNAKAYEVKVDNKALEQFLTLLAGEDQDLSDLDILGDKGIVITYYIADGYIVGQDMVFDLQLDLSKMGDVIGEEEAAEPMTGIINIEFNMSSVTYNIGGEVEVTFPELTEDNSFNYKEIENYTFE